MRFLRTVSEYRWPIYLGGLLAMSIVACGVIVWVATRPDSPRPIKGYYEAARAWDADEAVAAASRQLGWSVRYELPSDVPHYRRHAAPGGRAGGRPRREAGVGPGRAPVRDPLRRHAPQSVGSLTELPQQPGSYRTLVVIDAPAGVGVPDRHPAAGAALRPRGAAHRGPARPLPPGERAVTGSGGTFSGAGRDAPARRRCRAAPTAASRCRRGSCGTARSGSSAATAAGRFTRSSTSGDSTSTIGSSVSSAARSSRRASPGAPSRTSTTTALQAEATDALGDEPPPHAAVPRGRPLHGLRLARREAAGGARRRGRGPSERRQRRRGGDLATGAHPPVGHRPRARSPGLHAAHPRSLARAGGRAGPKIAPGWPGWAWRSPAR